MFRYDQCTWHFFLGERLIESITVDREVYRKFVPKNEDGRAFIWELFKVAQGEQEVARVQAMNERKSPLFEIKRVETEREEWLSSLTFEQYIEASRKGVEIFG